jgi:bacillithiol system protein YtxJ
MALGWSHSAQSIPEIDSVEECTAVLEQEIAVLFKHSPTCPVSWMAHREMMQFRSLQPDVPLYLISVRRRRDVSRFIAENTGIHHESPQVIVFRHGKAVAATSHDGITADTVCGFLSVPTTP